MTILEAILLAIVEGITEFLPVSSTGHLILSAALMNVGEDHFTKIFIVNIQFGAILSVVALYWRRFFQSFEFYLKLFVAFLPAAILGFLLGDYIDTLLESVQTVAVALFLGGVILIVVDKKFQQQPDTDLNIGYWQAFKIGLFQCIALVPGVSRSAATMIGGMVTGLNRKQAAEFSFFLAVPTMFAASAYKLLKDYQYINTDNLPVLLIGNAVSFVVAMLAIKSFIAFLTKNGFTAFGWYRIAVGVIILILIVLNIPLKLV